METLDQNAGCAYHTGLGLIMHRQPHLTNAAGITSFCYEIGVTKNQSQVAKTVAVNSLKSRSECVEEAALGVLLPPPPSPWIWRGQKARK